MARETQRPINADELGPHHAVFQIMWRDATGKLYVHQMKGSDVRTLLGNDPDATHLRDTLFWHMKASFLSIATSVFETEPIQMETEPRKPSPILGPGGKPYNSSDGKDGTHTG